MANKWRSIPESDHYQQHRFINLKETPMMAKGVNMWKVLSAMMKRPRLSRPPGRLPFIKRDLTAITSGAPVITWFGHSSYLIESRGFRILVDPVFSGFASPVKGFIKAFPGSNEYQPTEFPPIDLLIITHNHYDHLDTDTIRKFKSKIRHCVTSLGVGRELAHGGIDPSIITELDWWEEKEITQGVTLTATPARHFSGRGLVRGGSLWSSFVLKLHDHRIFIGGDSGYDDFFKTIGERFGPFDLAILECGQYNEFWPNIHMMPEETALAATELKAKMLLPVHWGKFTLANHVWTEPVERVLEAARSLDLPVVTPRIGEGVTIGGAIPQAHWWEEVK